MSTQVQTKNKLQSGKEITLSEANKFINEFNILKDCVEVIPKNGQEERLKEIKEFISSTNDYNAFVFSKDLIKRFFDANKGKDEANYLVVVLGAYFQDATNGKDDIDSKKGAFTVLTTGCIKEKDSYKVIDIHNPVNQYAPKMCISKLTVNIDENSFNIIR
ncbi:hypothetical protein [uncultured Kordia sp.]|uniref:hypothetical protein n=1 Tax=uncultured Kordia sp. TaxID=507699 RepID=UPI00262F1ACC|nr:hypothetical protein [uncultured Kordia sp.]